MNNNGNNGNNDSTQTISKYDRLRGNMQDIAMFTRPSTIKTVQTITGKADTFVVETCRYETGDYIFIECVDEAGVTRLALPPKVANAIASQRDSLTSRRRSIAAKKLAQERKDRNELPGFIEEQEECNDPSLTDASAAPASRTAPTSPRSKAQVRAV